MFSSISASREALVREMKAIKKHHLFGRIDVDLLSEFVAFLSTFSTAVSYGRIRKCGNIAQYFASVLHNVLGLATGLK